ncbi:polyribonucleotide nucleotidyltransferase [bacterium]|nr:polyribonucleotide nucleotidyltransferase [bacterium]
MEKKVYELNFRGRKLSVELGEVAKQAQGACIVKYEDTAVLSVCCVGKEPITQDFFPLTVLYQEKMYSNGMIPGGWLRREGRPTEHETLMSRVIDRPLRPLFKDGFRNEVQVINMVLSCNPDNPPQMAALFGSSLALSLGGVPIEAPIAGVIVGRINNEFIINPTQKQKEESDIDLTVSATMDAINMVEAGAKEVSESDMCDALLYAHDAIKELIDFENKIIEENRKPMLEIEYKTIPEEIVEFCKPLSKERIEKSVSIVEKQARANAIEAIEIEIAAKCVEKYKTLGYDKDELKEVEQQAISVMEGFMVDEVRRLILEDKVRPDGRKVDEIRPLSCAIDLLERPHGSAMFTRGQTQALAITTLGSLDEAQVLEGAQIEDNKRWMLHYNFPQFSVGEIGKYGSPGRREIGHGALAERALAQVMPSEDEFPYCIRTVSEILESNGSSSQATICASSMSLMAAGVPIKKQVAGIAMGLISDEKNYTILTDIQGLEDHFGDMDFKVAGTRDGITALQMDIKVKGIDRKILSEALAQAHKARMEILDTMDKCISTPRKEVSKYAPKIKVINIDKDSIKDVIGSGGKTINAIIEECNGVKIDISENGRVVVMHPEIENCDKAISLIENIVRKPEIGDVYDGTVTRIESYGAFIELWPGTEGLCHISRLSIKRIEKVEDFVKVGDILKVKIIKIDEKGRIDLSHAATMDGYTDKPKSNKDSKKSFKDSKKSFVNKDKEAQEDNDLEVVVVSTDI